MMGLPFVNVLRVVRSCSFSSSVTLAVRRSSTMLAFALLALPKSILPMCASFRSPPWACGIVGLVISQVDASRWLIVWDSVGALGLSIVQGDKKEAVNSDCFVRVAM